MISQHPSERFAAPNTILTGVPLKKRIGAQLVRLIAESFGTVDSGFDQKTFVQEATQGPEALELKDRARHIAHALARQLPNDVDAAVETLTQRFTAEFSIRPFIVEHERIHSTG